MKIFIIGGTGFISGHLTKKLLASGHEVTIYTRGITKKPENKVPGLQYIQGNRRDETALRNAFEKEKYDVVYDMVAYNPKDSEQAVNIFGGKIERFIHCSTISVYMISDNVQCPVTEEQWTKPIMNYWDRNPFGMEYGINKRKCEEVLWNANGEGKLKVSMIRPTYVCGPNDLAMRDFFWIERIMDGKPLLVPGSGDFAFQNVYVEDVAQAFHDLLYNEQTIGNAYNITAEEIFSLNEYIKAIGEILDKNVELVHLEQPLFDKLPISYNPNGDVFTFNVRRTAVFSLDHAKMDLKYKSTPFKVWMYKTIDWYLNEFKGHSYGYDKRQDELEIISKIKSNS